MLHSFRRFAAISAAVISTVVAPMLVAAAPAAHAAAGLTNCADLTRVAACYEIVWVDGVQFRMTFPQAANPLPAIPKAKVQNFYVIAPQTGTPQGTVPFNHDHVVAVSPAHSHGDFTIFMHGYFVVCSTQGSASGACASILFDDPRYWDHPAGSDGERAGVDVRKRHRSGRRLGSPPPHRHRGRVHRHTESPLGPATISGLRPDATLGFIRTRARRCLSRGRTDPSR